MKPASWLKLSTSLTLPFLDTFPDTIVLRKSFTALSERGMCTDGVSEDIRRDL